jgi:hypothetical protein
MTTQFQYPYCPQCGTQTCEELSAHHGRARMRFHDPGPASGWFMVTHDAGCLCSHQKPSPPLDAATVALYLWGRVVPNHVVWAGECPYRFFTANTAEIARVLNEHARYCDLIRHAGGGMLILDKENFQHIATVGRRDVMCERSPRDA